MSLSEMHSALQDVPAGHRWPNKMGRMMMLALEDVISRSGVNAVLNLAQLGHRVNNYPPDNLELGFDFRELSMMMQALEDMYGPRAGRNLAMRAGRAGFKYALREFGALLGLTDLAFRLLPLDIKLRVTLGVMADTFNNFSDQRVRLDREGDRFYYVIDRCPVCWSRAASEPCCYAATGLLQETVSWVGNGSDVYVREVSCVAAGAPNCTFVVSRHPLPDVLTNDVLTDDVSPPAGPLEASVST
jgi:predicted hydrocarbon binding protein